MAMSTAELAEVLRRREIKSINYFHADHFEPWSLGINNKTARGVERMREMSAASPFARKMSLFYCPFVPYNIDAASGKASDGQRVEGDAVVFGPRSAEQEKLARDVIRPLVMSDQHEMHLHVHHEFWTRNDSNFDGPVSRWVNANSTAELDERRLDLGFRVFKEVVSRDIGECFERWAFVHGNWALAGSDPLICKIESELSMIMRHGGFGDFSFPAGRGYCDPKLQAPFTCLPLDVKRAYDDPASDPRPVGSGAFKPGRFFIWNSPIRANFSSIDYYSAPNRDLFKDPSRMVWEWLSRSVSLGSNLFIKTHAHSMKWEYEIGQPGSLIPHCYPDVVSIFEELMRVCEVAGVEFRLLTANEIMDVLYSFEGMRAPFGLPLREVTMRSALAPPMPVAAPLRAEVGPARPGRAPFDGIPGWAHVSHLEGGPLPIDYESFNAELLNLQRAWIAGEGAAHQPDDLYAAKLKRGASLESYEVAVAAAIAEKVGRDTTIVEIGSGYGSLALHLAQNGFVVQGIEGDRRRSAACTWNLQNFVARYPQLAGRVRFVAGFFPDVMPAEADSAHGKRLCLATNVTCTYTARNQDAILAAIRDFDELVIDLSRFGKSRDTQEERDALRAVIAASHFEPVERLYFAAPYEYWRFRRRAATWALNPTTVAAPMADNAEPVGNAVFPLSGSKGVLYSMYGTRQLEACPVCHGHNTVGLWRMPMSNLKEPISLFGGYFNQVPTLQVPGTVYCFDFCRDCESVFLNPTPESQKDQYRKSEHYLRMMKDDAQWQGYENAFDRFAKWIPAGAATLMDAACGIGQYLEVARKREPGRWRRLIGLELSEKYVEDMRARNLEAYAFDIDNDDLGARVEPESVDFITFCEAFEHVERPLDALEKLLTTLRPGGRLYFTAQRYGHDVQAAVRPGEPIYIGEKVLNDLPKRLGCRVIDVTTSSMRYYVILEK